MKDTSYTRGTKRVEIEEPELSSGWKIAGWIIGFVAFVQVWYCVAGRLLG